MLEIRGETRKIISLSLPVTSFPVMQLPVISGDATSSDVISGDVTAPQIPRKCYLSCPSILLRFVSYLRYLCLFAYSGVQHILRCVFGLFLYCVLYGASFAGLSILYCPSVFSNVF
jgi:hypothetical protein